MSISKTEPKKTSAACPTNNQSIKDSVPSPQSVNISKVIGTTLKDELFKSDLCFEYRMEKTVQRLKATYLDNNEQEVLPESLTQRSSLDRLRNSFFLLLLHRRAKSLLTSQELGAEINQTLIRQEWDSFIKSPFRKLFEGDLFKRFKSGIQIASSVEEKTLHLTQNMQTYQDDFEMDIAALSEQFGEEYFGPSVKQRAIANIIAMRLFAALDHREILSRSAINAIGLLHPVTDDVMDRGNFQPKTMNKISDLLHGRPSHPEDKFEILVFKLISDIFEQFPRDQHPHLDWCLRRLHSEQLHSREQSHRINLDRLLDITFTKGGLSTIAAGYIALGGLTPIQSDFFFEGGAIFQIMDDLGDMEEDANDGIETVWTQSIGKNTELQRTLNRFLRLEAAFENELPNKCVDFRESDWVQRIYSFGYFATILRAVLNHPKELGCKVSSALDPYLPAPFWLLQSIARNISLEIRESPDTGGSRLHDLAASFLGSNK